MTDEISNDVTRISVDNVIYQEMFEIQYSFSKLPDEHIIFIKGFLDGNEIDETIIQKRLKTLKNEGKINNNASKKRNSFFY